MSQQQAASNWAVGTRTRPHTTTISWNEDGTPGDIATMYEILGAVDGSTVGTGNVSTDPAILPAAIAADLPTLYAGLAEAALANEGLA